MIDINIVYRKYFDVKLGVEDNIVEFLPSTARNLWNDLVRIGFSKSYILIA